MEKKVSASIKVNGRKIDFQISCEQAKKVIRLQRVIKKQREANPPSTP